MQSSSILAVKSKREESDDIFKHYCSVYKKKFTWQNTQDYYCTPANRNKRMLSAFTMEVSPAIQCMWKKHQKKPWGRGGG